MTRRADPRSIVIGALFAIFLAALESTIVATALPAIVADLGQVELTSWIVTAYFLSSVCATPVIGKLSDMYGRRNLLRISIGLFVGGSALCGFAPTMLALVGSRVLQGVGGGGLLTLGQAIVGDAVPPRERGRFAGYFSVVWMSAAVLGPLAGGLLTEHAGWRWIFLINLPLGALAAVLSERALLQLAPVRRAAHVDYLGIALLSGGAVALIAFVSAPRTLTQPGLAGFATIVAAALAIAFFVRRQRAVPEPIVPPHFLRDAVISPVLAASFLVFGGYIALTATMPLFFQLALGRSPAQSGMLLVPTMLSSSLAALIAGRYTRSHGRYRPPPMIGLPLAIGSVALLALAPARFGANGVAFFTACAGLGIGAIFPCTIVAAQAAAGPRDIGAVSGAINLARSLGAAVVTGLAMALLFVLIVRTLPEAAGMRSLDELMRRQLGSDARGAIVAAFGPVWWLIAAALSLGLAAFARVEERTLAG